MSSGRSVVFAGVVLLLAIGALVVMAHLANLPRPVDVRQVDSGPVEPGVLSATYTTTVQAARSTTSVVVVVPPAPPPVAPVVTTTEPPQSVSAPASTTSSRPPKDENCDPDYLTNGVCVPRRLPPGVWRMCEWLHEQGVTHVEVLGWDRHLLDLDHDGIACEHAA